MKDDIITQIPFHCTLKSFPGICRPYVPCQQARSEIPDVHFPLPRNMIYFSNNVLIHLLSDCLSDRYEGGGSRAASCAIIGYPPPDPEMRNGHNCARTRGRAHARTMGSGRNNSPHVRYLVHVRFPPVVWPAGCSDDANMYTDTETKDFEIHFLND